MNPRRLLALGLAVACGALLTGCSSGGMSEPGNPGGAIIDSSADPSGLRGAVLAQPYRMPNVTLTATDGSAFHLVSDTTSPVTLVFFGYTNCPDVCGLVMADIATAVSRLDPSVAADVQMLFITTDPARDTGPVLRSYLDHFNPDFQGLTGTMHDIRTVANALGVPVEGIQRLPDGGYEVGHGSQIVGIDSRDEAPVVWTEGTPVSDLEHDITVLDQQS